MVQSTIGEKYLLINVLFTIYIGTALKTFNVIIVMDIERSVPCRKDISVMIFPCIVEALNDFALHTQNSFLIIVCLRIGCRIFLVR